MKNEIQSAGYAAFVGVLAVVVIAIIAAVWLTFSYFSAETRGKVGMENHVASGTYQEYSYNHFFDACSAIQGYEASIAAQHKALTTADDSDKSRINTIIASVEAERGRAIAQYNVDANKMKTVARFKADGLPYHLDATAETTSCVN